MDFLVCNFVEASWVIWDFEKGYVYIVLKNTENIENEIKILQEDRKIVLEDYKEKIDVIYIDPPYNTGNKDFKYNDKFVKTEDGERHSAWLSFMNKRLLLAKEILKNSGVLIISIDENEQANLELLLSKHFGEKNINKIRKKWEIFEIFGENRGES